MHSATVGYSRYLESAGTAGTAVKKGSAANGVTAITATTEKPAGLLDLGDVQSKTLAEAQADPVVNLIVAGPAVGLAGAAVAIDDDVVVDATGKLVPKSAAGWVLGKAKTAAANGEYFELYVNIRKEPA